ncbi:hypothetical protein SAMN06295888_1535 [Desulfonatronum zhilinae]|nr:hypothetical protein SAMN06295888_1535 [Desulfonatronum zhilinae]
MVDMVLLLIALFGFWTFHVQLCTFTGADYAFARRFAFFPVLLTALFAVLLKGGSQKKQPEDQTDTTRSVEPAPIPWLWLLVPICAVTVYQLWGSEWAFWLLAAPFLAILALAGDKSNPLSSQSHPDVQCHELIALTGLCAISAVLVMGVNRPDPDDAFFVSLATAAINHPHLPLYGVDNLYRDGLPLVEQHLHLLQSHEYLAALIADFLGTPAAFPYYVLLPAFWAVVGTAAHWVALRRFLPPLCALVGLAAIILLLAFWGDGNRTFGNFSFVRMFQGKAVYLWVALPMIFYTAYSFQKAPTFQNWLSLMLAQGAAIGFTTNALVVGPMAAGLVLVSGMLADASTWKTTLKGLCASLPLVVAGVGMLLVVRQYHGPEQLDPVLLGYATVLGEQRTGIVLAGLLALPLLARCAQLPGSAWLSRYVAVSGIILLFPLTGWLFSSLLAPVFSWRYFWCWPVPLLLGLSVGMACCVKIPYPHFRRAAALSFLALFVLAGPDSVTSRNFSPVHIGEYKVPPYYHVARKIVDLSPREGLALVPEPLAAYVTGFDDAPPLVGVRLLYLRKLQGTIPDDDLKERIALLRYVGGDISDMSVEQFVAAIKQRGVRFLVVHSKHAKAVSLAKKLVQLNFSVIEYDDYLIFTV